jgi:hypothetical protein
MTAFRKAAWIGGVAVLVALPFLLRERMHAADPGAARIAPSGEAASLAAPPGVRAGSAVTSQGAELPRVPVSIAAEPSPVVAGRPTFAGRVVDLGGAPVAGVTVVLALRKTDPEIGREPGSAGDVSDAAGAFELPVARGTGTLSARGAGWASVVPVPLAWIPPPEPPRVV